MIEIVEYNRPIAANGLDTLVNKIFNVDLFQLCDLIPDRSVDFILCDLPYGTTACAWDEIIPFIPMWDSFKRILKPNGVIALTGSQPFTTKLNASNLDDYRYEWIVEKDLATGHLNANRVPMKAHETISIFYSKSPVYNPQMSKGKAYKTTSNKKVGGYIQDKSTGGYITDNQGDRYPRSVLYFNMPKNAVHHTQKPIDLFEYMIKTYTNPDDLVFDPCVGSGTTAIAARNTGRNYIIGDISLEYCQITQERLRLPFEPTCVKPKEVDYSDLPLFSNLY